jgi:hypothetical protein
VVAIAAVMLVAGSTVAFRLFGGGQGTNAAVADSTHQPGASADASTTASAAPTAGHSASPTPTPRRRHRRHPPAPTTSAPAPGPPPTSSSCTKPQFVSSDPNGGWTDGAYYVANDMWNISGYSVSQTIYACSHSNWYAVANMNNNSGDGAVKTYPNAHEDFNEPRISSFSSISSTFAETSPHVGIYEDAYDIWINGVASSGSTELMVWTENHGQTPSGSAQGTATVSGHTYTVYRSGSYIAFVANSNFTAGTVNLLSVFDWVMAKGWMPSTSTLGQIDYGTEIVSTGGSPATFAVHNFSVSTG